MEKIPGWKGNLEKQGENAINQQANNGYSEAKLQRLHLQEPHHNAHIEKAGKIEAKIKECDHITYASANYENELTSLEIFENFAKVVYNRHLAIFYRFLAHSDDATQEI